MAIDLLKYMIWKNGTGGGASYEKTVGPAPIISVADAKAKPAKSLVVGMEPIQDLHGYDNPWPAGGNYNKLSAASAFTHSGNGITLRSDGMGVYTLSGTATADFSYKFDIPEMIMPGTVYVHIMNSAGASGSSKINLDFYNVDTREDFVGFGTSSNRKYNGTTALGGKTINALQIRVVNGEAISGTLTFSPMVLLTNDTVPFAPYSNECPITGRTGVTAWRTGANLFDYDATKATTGTTPAGTIRAYYPLGLKGLTLSFSASLVSSGSVTTSNINIGKLKNGVLNVAETFISPSSITNRTVTFAADEEAVFMTASDQVASITLNFQKYIFQVEVGSSVTDYSAYTGATYPVSWQSEAGTVYGGTVDVVSGVLTGTWAIVDMGSLNWNTIQGYPNVFSSSISGKADGQFNLISTMFQTSKTGTLANVPDMSIVANLTGYGIFVKDTQYSDKDLFKTAVTGQSVCYELATPQLVQLTPTQVQMLLGVNNVWANTGAVDLTLTYLGTTPPNLLGGMLGGGLGNPQEPTEETSEEPVSEEPEE